MKSIWIATLTLAALFAAGCTTPQEPAAPPNIIFILADDLGYGDLGVYGQKTIQTPSLDALASQGMRFTCAYTAQPICSPSRAAVMTGKCPARLNLTRLLLPGLHPPRLDRALRILLGRKRSCEGQQQGSQNHRRRGARHETSPCRVT